MAQLWTPDQIDAVRKEDLKEARKVIEFGKRLKALDVRFDVWPQMTTEEIKDRFGKGTGNFLRAGYFYISRSSDDGATEGIWEVSHPDGTYKLPDDQVLDAFKAMDSWNKDVYRQMVKAREEKEQRIARDKERAREEQRDKIADRISYALDVKIAPHGRGPVIAGGKVKA